MLHLLKFIFIAALFFPISGEAQNASAKVREFLQCLPKSIVMDEHKCKIDCSSDNSCPGGVVTSPNSIVQEANACMAGCSFTAAQTRHSCCVRSSIPSPKEVLEDRDSSGRIDTELLQIARACVLAKCNFDANLAYIGCVQGCDPTTSEEGFAVCIGHCGTSYRSILASCPEQPTA